MSSDLNELFAFALNFYRAPLQHQGQMENCEPDSAAFTRLLEIVSRPDSSNDLNSVASALQKSPETLISAALFLIRQLLFAEKGNHYKVLGLQQTASQKEIKKRYRTLISLFHPDKNPEGEEWSQLYAPDLNDAYNELKNESRRSNYDLSLSSARGTRQTNSYQSGRRNSSQSSYSRSSSSSTPHRAHRVRTQTYTTSPLDAVHRVTLWQKHPQLMIWGSVLIILTLVIIAKYSKFPDDELDVSTTDSADIDRYQQPARARRDDVSNVNETSDALKFALQQTAPTYSQHEARDSDRLRDSGNVRAADDVSAVINQYMTDEARAELSIDEIDENSIDKDNRYADEQVAIDEQNALPDYPDYPGDSLTDNDTSHSSITRMPLTEINTEVNTEVHAEPENVQNQDSYEVIASSETLALQNVQAKPAVPATKATAAASTVKLNTTTAESTSNPFAKENIEFLIARYITAYDSGNLNKMTELFTNNVRTKAGIGIDIVRNDYFKLFRDTAERSIVIKNIQSGTPNGNETIIHFQTYVQVRSTPSSKWKYYSGKMQFTLTDMDKGLKISSLSHNITQDK